MEDKGKLTERQQEILDYIIEQQKKKGYPPSVRDIGAALGIRSSSTVHMHLTNIEEKGYIHRDPTKPRAIEILQDSDENVDIIAVPVVGNVAAGVPITAEENIDSYFHVAADFLGHGSHFILNVKGDSMIEAGIFDGDMVIVRSQKDASNGEIVVALMDDSATVKRFYRRADHVELQPENPAMEPIITRDVSIIGVVSAVIRKIH